MSIPAAPVPPPSDNWAGPSAPRMLPYSSISYGRPGLLTGLGVTSIVLASLGILWALWSGLMLVPWFMMSSMQFNAGPTGTVTVATTPANTLTPEEAELIVTALASRQPLSDTDKAALVQALPLAELPISPPADSQWTAEHVLGQLSYVSSWNDGTTSSVDYTFSGGGSINLASGTVTVNIYNANGWSSTTISSGVVTGNTTNNFGAATAGFAGPDKVIMAMSFGSVVLSLGLAVLLLVAGIQTVRGVPSGRLLHLWWAWPKIGVAALAAYINYRFWSGAFFGGAPGGLTMAMVAGTLAFGVAWPVAVLLMLRSPSLRAYYGPEGEAQPRGFPVEATM